MRLAFGTKISLRLCSYFFVCTISCCSLREFQRNHRCQEPIMFSFFFGGLLGTCIPCPSPSPFRPTLAVLAFRLAAGKSSRVKRKKRRRHQRQSRRPGRGVTRKPATRQWSCCLPAGVCSVVYNLLVGNILILVFRIFQTPFHRWAAKDNTQHSLAARPHRATQNHGTQQEKEQAQTAPQTDSGARQHSTTEHDTEEQSKTADHAKHREAGHVARQGHRHRNTPPEDNRGQPDPARHHRTPQEQAKHRATHHSTRHHQQRRPEQHHNTSAPAQRSKAPQRAERTGNAQHDTPGHTQHTHAAQSTAANNSTHQQTTAKQTQHREHSAGEHHKTQRRKANDPRATESARVCNTTSKATKRAKQHNTTQRRAEQRATTRRSTAPRDTAQHSMRHRRPNQDSKAQREQRSKTTRPETQHKMQQQPTAWHNTKHRTAISNTGRRGTTARHAARNRATLYRKTPEARAAQRGNTRQHKAQCANQGGGGGRREPPMNAKQGGRSKAAEEKHGTPSSSEDNRETHTRGGWRVSNGRSSQRRTRTAQQRDTQKTDKAGRRGRDYQKKKGGGEGVRGKGGQKETNSKPSRLQGKTCKNKETKKR